MKFKKDNALVGLFVGITALVSLSVLFFLLGYDFYDDRKFYLMRFDRLSGIKVHSPIILKGHQVGEVIRIQPSFGSNIYFKAWVRVDKDLQLYRGTRATITNQNVIGDATLRLDLPKDQEFVMQEYDTIFATGTQNLDELISSMAKLTTNLNELVSSVTSIAGSNSAGVGQIITGINAMLSKVNGILEMSEGNIVKIMGNMAATTRTLRLFARDIRRNPLLLLSGKK